MPRATLLVRVRARASDLPSLCGLKHSCGDDREIWHLSSLPVRLRVRMREPLAAVGIFDHPDLVPDEPARIEFIVQKPDPALRVAVDRGRIPHTPARGRNSLFAGATTVLQQRPQGLNSRAV